MCWELSLLSECLSSPMAELGARDVCALSHQHDKLASATSLAEVLLALQAALPPGHLAAL